MDSNKYPAPHPQVAARIVDGSAVIVLADLGTVNVLNSVGTRVWELMDGKRNILEIIASIEDEYEVSPEQAARDVEELVRNLIDAQAIVLKDSPMERS